MSPAIQLENVVVEILDAQAEAGDADAVNGRQLALGERAGLALERDFLGMAPAAGGGEPADELLELTHRQKRRRAAAEINEIQRPPGDGGARVVQLPLARHHVEILFDLVCVLVGVDAEIAEVTALAAERDVKIQAERRRRWRRAERRHRIALNGLARPY